MRLPKSTIQKYALPPEKECISAIVGGKFLSKVIKMSVKSLVLL